MSIGYDVLFHSAPDLHSLDTLMQRHGLTAERSGLRKGDFTRVFTNNPNNMPGLDLVEFFYEQHPSSIPVPIEKRRERVTAYGFLKTVPSEPPFLTSEERLEAIEKHGVVTELDWRTHMQPSTRPFYRLALDLRDTYKATVLSEQTGQEINPLRVVVRPELR